MSAETKYRQFTDEDNDVWAKLHAPSGKIDILGTIRYSRGRAMANEIERQNVIGQILKENGITINVVEKGNPENFSLENERISFFPQDIVSLDRSIYKYFIMPDEGRGWGIFIKKTADGHIEVLEEDHIDNMTEKLIKFAQKCGVDLETKYASDEDIEELDGFEPSPKDF